MYMYCNLFFKLTAFKVVSFLYLPCSLTRCHYYEVVLFD